MAAGNAGEQGLDPKTAYPFEDLMTSLLFVVIGLGAFVIALGYEVGTVRRPGPGVLPMLVSALLRACPNFCVNGMLFTPEGSAPRTGW